MAVIKPFRALRPAPEKAKVVSCVPYDVAHDSEVREFIGQNPASFLRVTRPESDFPNDEQPSTETVLERARENLQSLIDEGVFAVDREPSLYVYRLVADSHEQTGVVACCSLDEYEQGLIKKHEKTRPDKVADRTRHMIALKAQTGLIFLAFRGTDTIRELIDNAVVGHPIYDFALADNVRHTIWKISHTDDWIAAFAEVPALYIADGHHRAESAEQARKYLRDQNPTHNGAEDYNFVVAGIFPAEDLKILAYNRVVTGLGDLTDEQFLSKLSESFIVTETTEKEPRSHGEICMYMAGKWYKLEFSVKFFREPDPIERLDVNILQDYILRPILGIDDARTDKRIGFVGGKRGTSELEKLVDEGEAMIAFSLFPTTMDDLLAVSDMGEIMPPKSTWFEPKLKDGLLVHLI